ncbi:MAG: hypothetical protein V5B40_03510 [Candidatus Accumulibacter meliphilus]|uniref:hypothetical protein n=1 Tax=Candidatus Accumulibacter meliphilus TaxID=2211374 RepID=UPI002FC29B5D
MSIFEKRLTIPLHVAILLMLVLLLATFLVMFWFFSPLGKGWASPEGYLYVLAAGLVPGLVVATFQYLLQWFEFREISRLRALKVKEILLTRDDSEYYGALISNARKTIDLMGGTASRFLEDFASSSSPREEKRVLLAALRSGVVVRIIVAHEKHLDKPEQKEKFAIAARRLAELSNEHPNNFEYRYYKHAPTHIVLRVDDDCLVGPQFPNIRSKDTPAVHTVCDGAFAKPYIQYLENEWEAACG